eukprot:TRINITY_DN47095_c0_g1_i1.p1 TRINITY_DN47095_c0_g1~~TRINITY_DN47095_c0_g1_i1.p1  ORF type:complete len:699 (-),score=112.45 TRINITY_DN47095_c0_g1_i1:138-2126(-)
MPVQAEEDPAIAIGKAAYKAARAKGLSHEEATQAATAAAGRPPPSTSGPKQSVQIPQPQVQARGSHTGQAAASPISPKASGASPASCSRAPAHPPARVVHSQDHSIATVRGFLAALRAEYLNGNKNGVGNFFESNNVPAKVQEKLDPLEDTVRNASDKERAVRDLEAQAPSIAASIVSLVTPIKGLVEIEAGQLSINNENASVESLLSSISQSLSLPTGSTAEATALAGLAAQDLEILRKALRLIFLLGWSQDDKIREAETRLRAGLQLPADWDLQTFCAGRYLEGSCGGRQSSGVLAYEIQKNDVVNVIQHLFDKTYRKVYTRDRRGAPIPDAFKIKSAYRVLNDQVWREYVAHRESVREALCGGHHAVPDGVQTMNSLKSHTGAAHVLPPLDAQVNECWLYHGTTAAAASGIAENDFRLDLTGSNAGTLYGKGIYLAENATKSDEYGEGPRGPAGEQMEQGYEAPRPPPGPPPSLVRESYILVCRSTLGKVNYNDEQRPDADKLQQSCLGDSSEFHSVIGDRLKLNGTFRELVVYMDDQVYPEYIIHYERIFFHERFADIYKAMMRRKRQGKFDGPTSEEKDVLQSMWNVYAMPNKGKINKWQLLDLLNAIGQPPENEMEDLDATFQEWATKKSKDGKIDWDEFLQEMTQRVKDGMTYYE